MNGLFLEEDQRKFMKGNLKGNFSSVELKRGSSEMASYGWGKECVHETRNEMECRKRSSDGDLYNELCNNSRPLVESVEHQAIKCV